MIKTLSIFSLSVMMIIAVPFVSRAELTDYSTASGHVVWDSIGGQYWYWNLPAFTNKTWAEQSSAVSALNGSSYFGLTDWRVASVDDMTKLWTNDAVEIIEEFNPVALATGDFCVGRYDSMTNTTEHHVAGIVHYANSMTYDKSILEFLSTLDNSSTEVHSVWATSSGPNPVPEPATMLLFGAGLVGLAGFGRKKFKK